MPFARFARLASEKRERLLDVAAQEFASRGFEQASLNRILERANMGKGSAYYYFEDKADLFGAVIAYATDVLGLTSHDMAPAPLTPETFWPTLTAQHRLPLVRSFERPWLFSVLNIAAQLPPALTEREPLASLARRARDQVMELIKHGQKLEMIRRDLPEALLLAWLLALDRASDDWLMSNVGHLDKDTVTRISDQTVAAIARAFAPEVDAAHEPT